MVQNVSFNMTGMCHGPNGQIQHVWNGSWSKLLVLAWLECVMVKIISFSIARICHSKNSEMYEEEDELEEEEEEEEEEEDWYYLDQLMTTSLVK
jgi:flagellar biosynthesis/type III secretory pathway M-ring protein FliF/YscJ